MGDLQKLVLDGVVFYLDPVCCEAVKSCLEQYQLRFEVPDRAQDPTWLENRMASFLLEMLDKDPAPISSADIKGFMKMRPGALIFQVA